MRDSVDAPLDPTTLDPTPLDPTALDQTPLDLAQAAPRSRDDGAAAAARSEAPAPDRLSARDRTILAVLLVSTFVVILNETIMSVALPVLLTDLHVTASTGQWLTAGFLLTMSVVIPVTGFLIQRVPTRALFAAAMGLFSLGTLAAALSPGFEVLLTARVVQACGTAIMLPLLMTTVMTLVPEHRRGMVMGNTSIVISVAPAIGPTVSGLVLAHLSWRFMFWLVLPIALTALVVGTLLMSQVGERSHAPVDVPSVLLSAAGFGGLVYGLSTVGSSGSTSPVVVAAAFVVGVAALVAFVLRQTALQRTDRALLDLRTFGARAFSLSTGLTMVTMASLLGSVVLVPLYVQNVLHRTPLVTGLILLPGGLVMGLCGPIVGRLYDRVGARALMLPGAALTAAALWTTVVFGEHTPVPVVLGFHLTLSVGLALVFTPLFAAGLGAVPPHLYSHGSAILATAQQLAGAAGVALLVSVFSARTASAAAGGASLTTATLDGLHLAFILAAVLSLIGVVVAALFPGTRPETAGGVRPGAH